MSLELTWLPPDPEWTDELRRLRAAAPDAEAWPRLLRLAGCRMSTVEAARLDRELGRQVALAGPPTSLERVRVAMLGSATMHHLLAGLRIAGLRRGLWLEIYEGGYGQYVQEALEPPAALLEFHPEVVVFVLDAEHMAQLAENGERPALAHLERCWRSVQERFGAAVMQQAGLPRFADLLGSNEDRLAESPQARLAALNTALRAAAQASGVALLALDRYVQLGGVDAWHDPALWHVAKQEVHPNAAAIWGELLARLIAAVRGRSKKCLVLDLDNTLWGGVLGEEGAAALRIGQGGAEAEAYLAFQQYCLRLRERGVLLAVCSKNDEATARAAFAVHPEMPLRMPSRMPLRLSHFASFAANWDDKATNLRRIAGELNLGLDALVFFDDNPAERELIRRELPEVAVPETCGDPAGFVQSLSRAGYFEAVFVTEDDRRRAEAYAAERMRHVPVAQVTEMRGYLRGLKMRMRLQPFDEANLPRIVQLANKTNQFNLTVSRPSAETVRQWMRAPEMLTWQAQLEDRFGDSGTIALLAGEVCRGGSFDVRLWLMSCRVFGREVEQACLNAVVETLRARGVSRLVAPYRRTAKNGLLAERLTALGFVRSGTGEAEIQHWELALESYVPQACSIVVEDERAAGRTATPAQVV